MRFENGYIRLWKAGSDWEDVPGWVWLVRVWGFNEDGSSWMRYGKHGLYLFSLVEVG